jgi:peptidyl-Lys metalloendopeptidase
MARCCLRSLRTDLGKVYLGLKFFEAPASTGYDSRLGTLVHEITHLWITGNTNRTSAEVYPKAECLILARTNPVGAQNNAQNYEYFVEDWLMR